MLSGARVLVLDLLEELTAFEHSCTVPESLARQTETAIASVVESQCPLCQRGLVIHDDRACCPCCGDSYVVETSRLEVRRCSLHGRDCPHWHAVWELRSRGSS